MNDDHDPRIDRSDPVQRGAEDVREVLQRAKEYYAQAEWAERDAFSCGTQRCLVGMLYEEYQRRPLVKPTMRQRIAARVDRFRLSLANRISPYPLYDPWDEE